MRRNNKIVSIDGIESEVTGLFHNSKQVIKGSMFFVLRDGKYIKEAIKNGASVVVSEVGVFVDSKVKHIIVDDVRETMALVAKQFYDNVIDKMRVTGVVGTNGKTTTTYMVKHLLEIATGKNVGLVGTTGIMGAGTVWDGVTTLTTPDPIDLHSAIFAMYNNGIRDVVMEVSAHAIYYNKIAGIKFSGVIFTNITQDHLDFFSSFDHYKNTKTLFFKQAEIETVVINADDKYSGEVASAIMPRKNIKSISYSLKKDSIIGTNEWAFVENVVLSKVGSEFHIGRVGCCNIPVPGLFNIYNAVASALLCNSYKIGWDIIKEGLRTLPPVPGRFNTYNINGVTAVIDYAHTPDALEKILLECRGLLSNSVAKLLCVFGCGGDRDRSKRGAMGTIAIKNADFVVLTSDNPRTENPESIIDEIEEGIKRGSIEAVEMNLDDKINEKYIKEVDRTKAIYLAMQKAKVGDIVVIAGKGHEPYMDINGNKIPYMDSKVLDTIIRG